ncbi:hypothetical protein ID866_3911 [Astraeus odoratus]|nr:hypothetical protein ID866_3911 [Astraeus odoratus]
MAQCTLSPFERLVSTNPVLDLIAFYVAVDPFLGPPSNLLPLLLTSRIVYNHLRVKSNPHLYANIFCHKFDCDAPERRLSPRWTTAPCLTEELRTRCTALKYIRKGKVSVQSDRDVLWTAYLMMLENDGRNEEQLCGWANLPQWALSAVALHCLPLPSQHIPSDPECISLAYSSVFAPDAYFYLPLCEDHDDLTDGFSGPTTTVATINYYGHRLQLAVPPLTPAALLNFLVRREARQDSIPLNPQVADLPANRAEAAARGIASPSFTQADVREFHYGTRTHYFKHHASDNSDRSLQLDTEWFRLVSCYNLWDIERPLRGVVYSLGTLVGDWHGRMLVPDMDAYINAVIDPRVLPTAVPMAQERIACRFEEHHCLRFSEPLVAPLCPNGTGGEDVLNAWLPQDMRIVRRANGLQIFDPSTQNDTWYETYHAGRTMPYSTGAHKQLLSEGGPEWHREALPSPTGDDTSLDEYEDYVEHKLSGVQDILITGETDEKQGEAWGYYSYIGRVRQWDGLVVLLRIPMNNATSGRGRSIFKGYVHGRSLVGRWRDTTTAMHAIGYECGFVLCHQDEKEAGPV